LKEQIDKPQTGDAKFRYDGEAGKQYAKDVGQTDITHLGYQIQSKKILPHLKSTDNVLDFGCGNGSLARCLVPHVSGLEGVEVNSFTRSIARDNANIKVHAGLNDIDPDKRYDVIYTNHVLEHIEDVVGTLKYLRHYLKPKGKLLIIVPAEDFRSAPQKDWRTVDPDHHLHTWTPRLLANTLRNASFVPETIDLKSTAWVPQLFFLGDNLLTRFIFKLKGIILRRHELFACAVKN